MVLIIHTYMKRSSLRVATPVIGSTVMGERGQIVIPKDLRDGLGLKTGSKLLLIRHPHGPIILMPAEHLKGFVAKLTKQLKDLLPPIV